MALVVWYTGEITHVHLRTAAKPPPPVSLGTVHRPRRPSPGRARTQPRSVPRSPGRTVITYSRHAVTGRDALTGSRSGPTPARIARCAQPPRAGGNTIAIYEKDGNCDEVTTLDSATGDRQWERTLTDNGRPTYQVRSTRC